MGRGLRIVREIGRGGMGVVYEAEDLALRRRVAVKVVLPEAVGDAAGRARFSREARAAASLTNPHCVKVFAVDELADGSPYVVMELLDGESVDAILAREGPLPVEFAVGWLVDALEALAEAHARGLVHRDVKPSNLLVTRDGVKLLDFGLVRSAEDPRLTATGEALGSPLYMSPEQVWSSHEVDARADVWSAGVTLFEMLTARGPFDAQSVPKLLARITTGEPAPLAAYRPDAPPAVAQAIARCLARDRTARYPDASALRAALAAAVARPLPPPPRTPNAQELAITQAAAPEERTAARRARARRPERSSMHVLVVAILATLIVGGTGLAFGVRYGASRGGVETDAGRVTAAPAESRAPIAPVPEIASVAPPLPSASPPPERAPVAASPTRTADVGTKPTRHRCECKHGRDSLCHGDRTCTCWSGRSATDVVVCTRPAGADGKCTHEVASATPAGSRCAWVSQTDGVDSWHMDGVVYCDQCSSHASFYWNGHTGDPCQGTRIYSDTLQTGTLECP